MQTLGCEKTRERIKKAIEKFRTAQNYIAEKDYSRLTAMLNDILSSDSAKLFDEKKYVNFFNNICF